MKALRAQLLTELGLPKPCVVECSALSVATVTFFLRCHPESLKKFGLHVDFLESLPDLLQALSAPDTQERATQTLSDINWLLGNVLARVIQAEGEVRQTFGWEFAPSFVPEHLAKPVTSALNVLLWLEFRQHQHKEGDVLLSTVSFDMLNQEIDVIRRGVLPSVLMPLRDRYVE